MGLFVRILEEECVDLDSTGPTELSSSCSDLSKHIRIVNPKFYWIYLFTLNFPFKAKTQ